VGRGGACPKRGLAKIGKKGEADEQSCLGRIKKTCPEVEITKKKNP